MGLVSHSIRCVLLHNRSESFRLIRTMSFVWHLVVLFLVRRNAAERFAVHDYMPPKFVQRSLIVFVPFFFSLPFSDLLVHLFTAFVLDIVLPKQTNLAKWHQQKRILIVENGVYVLWLFQKRIYFSPND